MKRLPEFKINFLKRIDGIEPESAWEISDIIKWQFRYLSEEERKLNEEKGIIHFPDPLRKYNCNSCKREFQMDQMNVRNNTSPDWSWEMLCGRKIVTFHCPDCDEIIVYYSSEMS
jgi:predicted RNA-binding Zn-ribbon protein involved in translation (DUF1610 family)